MQREWKSDATDFLQKMLSQIETKNELLKQLELENSSLKHENDEL